MKDIQEIMKEMDNISDEMAVALEGETIYAPSADAAVAPAQIDCDDCGDVGGISDCVTPSGNIDFSCLISAPSGFFFPTNFNNPRILYDLNCLDCFIEPCLCTSGDVQAARYAVRVVGCISYIVNARVNPQENQCTSSPNNPNPNVFLCCHDSVCVDTTICNVCFYEQAVIACANIRANLNCSGIGIDFGDVDISGDNTTATVTGTFILPTCNGVV